MPMCVPMCVRLIMVVVLQGPPLLHCAAFGEVDTMQLLLLEVRGREGTAGARWAGHVCGECRWLYRGRRAAAQRSAVHARAWGHASVSSLDC